MSKYDSDYAAVYFGKTQRVLTVMGDGAQRVLMQVFQKDHSVLYGIKEAVEILRSLPNGNDLVIQALPEGSNIEPWETVMTIFGNPADFVAAESQYLGVLARGTRVASNMRKVVDAANGKPVIFMGDRFDRFENQAEDGKAALVGGAASVVTPAMAGRGKKAVGTMPHALIACYFGDIAAACRAYANTFDEPVTALVDFNNDCVGDSLKALAELGDRLGAVRLDTSEKMIDVSLGSAAAFARPEEEKALRGVNPTLVREVRAALDDNGGEHVKIVVSGGFTPEKITKFEDEGVPVDVYGVGSSIIKNGPDFTADIVWPVGKAGRPVRPNPKLVEVR